VPIKIGVLGCSSAAKRLVIPAILKSKDFKLSGIASRSEVKASEFAGNFNTLPYTYDELLTSDVDAIYVSLPVGLHYQWGKKVLQSQKHLLMEKTFTETYNQAKELFELSDTNQLACMEALMYQYHPLQNQIAQLVSDIGKIKHIETFFGFPHFDNKEDIRYFKELGGGAILDCLVYPLSFVFRFLGENYCDYKPSIYYDKETEVDERGYIQIEYPTATANISYGFGHSYRNEATIWGENGILKINRVFTRPDTCEIPIEFWKDGLCKKIKTQSSNHFVDMLKAFSDNIEALKNDSQSTLVRAKFIDKLTKR
tara:strand:+ start:7313 stop:8248 length:936 start_codon:yes stop_codon:yes gene_type:complete